MSRHLTHRHPKAQRFAWGRVPLKGAGTVVYRLFRRDHRGALHTTILHFYPRDTRHEIALALRQACHQLRDRVDEIDLAAMGVIA